MFDHVGLQSFNLRTERLGQGGGISPRRKRRLRGLHTRLSRLFRIGTRGSNDCQVGGHASGLSKHRVKGLFERSHGNEVRTSARPERRPRSEPSNVCTAKT